ncbi:MAG: carbon storage regulator [Gemmatimonadaceae bacterium]|nr:carbon storage regulator [Gemmatimonadaceae bacterium]
MLILSRRAGQGFVLDGDIRIEVLACDGRTVRLGIEAPSSVRILRGELVDSVAEETRRAVEAAASFAAAGAAAGAVIQRLSPAGAPRAATPPATEA